MRFLEAISKRAGKRMDDVIQPSHSTLSMYDNSKTKAYGTYGGPWRARMNSRAPRQKEKKKKKKKKAYGTC